MSLRDSIDKILEWVLIFLMSVLVIDVLWQVVSRYILINPSSFTTEVAGYLLIWVGILGAAYVAGKNEHLAIDLLLQKSSHKRRLRLLISIFLTGWRKSGCYTRLNYRLLWLLLHMSWAISLFMIRLWLLSGNGWREILSPDYIYRAKTGKPVGLIGI